MKNITFLLIAVVLHLSTLLYGSGPEHVPMAAGTTIDGNNVTITEGGTYDLANTSLFPLNTEIVNISCPGQYVYLKDTGNGIYPFRVICAPGTFLELLGVNISPPYAMSIYGNTPLTFQGSGNRLYLYGTNILSAGEQCPAIRVASGTSLYIDNNNSSNPGILHATGGELAAGIGGGYRQSAGTISIGGGKITAENLRDGAGIGGGGQASGGIINIYGGTIVARGNLDGAGIGGGSSGSCATVNIYGGTVTANGGRTGAYGGGPGIGNGGRYTGTSGYINIKDGTVSATGGTFSAGIGGGYGASGPTMKIEGGTITAIGSNGYITGAYDYGAAGIGGGTSVEMDPTASGIISISGGLVKARGGYNAAGIGGARRGTARAIILTGGTIYATGNAAHDIGNGGYSSGSGTLSIGGNAEIFLGTASSITPSTTTHTYKHITNAGSKVYGVTIRTDWIGKSFGAYLRLYTLSYDSNGGTGSIPQTDQHINTTTTISNANGFTRNGHTFTGWNSKADGSGTPYAAGATFTFDKNLALYAQWSINNYQVTILDSDGTTLVNQSVPYGTDATTAIAFPPDGYHFRFWENPEGDSITSQNPLTVQHVECDTMLRAVCEINRYPVTFIGGPGGSMDGEVHQMVAHGSDAMAVTALADIGWHFRMWQTNEGDSITDSNTIVVANVVSDTTLVAVFEINNYAVNFTADLHGTLEGITSQTVDHGSDAKVVEAVAGEGWHFAQWTGLLGDSITNVNPLTLTGVVSDSSLVAVFAINRYDVNFTSEGQGSLSGEASQSVDHGSDALAVEAVAGEGWHFAQWTGLLGDSITNVNPLTLTGVVSDSSLVAVFGINRYTITFSAGVGGSVTGELSQTVCYNQDASVVEAVADDNYRFSEWQDRDGNMVSVENPLTLTSIVSDRWVTAVFEPAVSSETSKAAQLRVYPNPTRGELTIEGQHIERVDILTAGGRILGQYDGGCDRLTIHLSVRTRGIYFVRICTKEGVSIRKIILEP